MNSNAEIWALKARLTALEPGGSGAGLFTAGDGLTESPAGQVNVGAHADGSIVVAANTVQVGVINATQHGNLTGGALHAAASAVLAGFVSLADQDMGTGEKRFSGKITAGTATGSRYATLYSANHVAIGGDTPSVANQSVYPSLWFQNNAAIFSDASVLYAGIGMSSNQYRISNVGGWGQVDNTKPSWSWYVGHGASHDKWVVSRTAAGGDPNSPTILLQLSSAGRLTVTENVVAGGAVSATGTVTGSNLSGTNTGDAPWTAKDEGSTLTAAVSSVDFVGGGVTATNVGGAVTVTIPTGAGGVTTVGSVGSGNASAASISGTTLTVHVATATQPGVVALGTQTLGSGTKTVDALVVTGDLTVDTNTFKVDSTNNRVGVLNASPAYPVDITEVTTAFPFRIRTGSSDDGFWLGTTGSDEYYIGAAVLWNGSNWIAKVATPGLHGYSNQAFKWFADTGKTVAASYTPTQLMTLNNSGHLGVGMSTTTPAYRLEVVRAAATGGQVRIGTTTTDDGMYLHSNTAANSYISMGSNFNGTNWIAKTTNAGIYTYNGNNHEWYTNTGLSAAGSYAPTKRMDLSATGVLNVLASYTANGVAVPTISSSDTLTNKTITSPVMSGTWTGNVTLSGNLTLSGANSHTGTSNSFSNPITYKGTTGITAFAGGGQASATALTAEINYVTTVATAADSVKLPTAALGLRIEIFNLGAASLNIFPASGGAIDALATNAAYALAAGSSQAFDGQSATQWRSRTVAAAAGTLTGTTLASNVTASSLTSVGTIATGVWQGTAIADSYIASAATWNSKAASGANTDITSVLLNQTGLVVKGGSSNALTIKPNETLTAGRTLNVKVNDVDRTVDLSGNLTVSSAATVAGTNTGDEVDADATHAGRVNLSTQWLGAGVKGVDGLTLSTSTPATPAVGHTHFAQPHARPLVAFVDKLGQVSRLSPYVGHVHIAKAVGDSSTTIYNFASTSNVTGSAAAAAWANTSALTKAHRAKINSAGSAGSQAVHKMTPAGYSDGGFFVNMQGGYSTQTATFRWFMGVKSGNFANADPSAATNLVGVGQDVGDTLIYFIFNGAGTATKTSTGLSTPANTDLIETSVYWYPGASDCWVSIAVNRGTPVILNPSSNLPAAGTPLGAVTWANNGSTASLCALDFCYQILDTLS
jgi:hypothetical protein